MAKSNAFWGIDIGQCALKALRCRLHEKDPNRLVVDSFDYIEYPKILSQPEADRDELIREALEEFVSRNEFLGDRVSISVSGQSGLARFIKLPPVEQKKIPDIVKYEARQQIPFALEDVVWDYQPLSGGSMDEGYALESEVGLFAIKRDQVAKALRPLEEAGIEIDIVQLAPLALYNFLCFDRLQGFDDEPYDPANPPKSTVIISLGTDTTDLVITNGFRVWQRNIPIGGNHFTKSLTKELKLTFAKAEHLKRNAMKAENPKAVFQAMRPVFSDLVAEIQRSIGFFTSNNRNAKLGETIALGNPMKLPGLQRFLSQNLDQDVKLVDQFQALVGGSTTAVPQFKDNQYTFGIAYGLCVQAADQAQLKTNLLPKEILTKRLIKAKKPWTVAAAALLLVGIAVNYMSHYSAWVSADKDEPTMSAAINASKQAIQNANTFSSEHEDLKTKFDQITRIGSNLVSNVDGRLLWLELFKAVDSALPRDTRLAEEREETVADISNRPDLHVTSMDCEYFSELGNWFGAVERYYTEAKHSAAELRTQQEPADDPAVPVEEGDGAFDPAAEVVEEELGVEDYQVYDDYSEEEDPEANADSPTGAGWVIQIVGYHFHNGNDTANEGERFIRNSFFKNLEEGVVQLPDGPNGELVDVQLSDLGIGFPVVVTKNKIQSVTYWAEAVDSSSLGRGGRPASSSRGRSGAQGPSEQPKTLALRRYDFIIQFCWQPVPRAERRAKATQDGGGVADGSDPESGRRS